MPVDHVFWVPVTLGIGVALGYVWGAKTIRERWEKAERRRRQDEAA
jgi:hypothetical protein